MEMEPEVLEHIIDGRKKPTKLGFSLLMNITNNFSEEREIGKGGFATVYKGVLPNGNVAVKRIMNIHTINDAPFFLEVDTLLAVNHENIVQFLGYCASTDLEANSQEGSKAHIYAEQRERLLCFEYIGNGSLQEHITDELRGLEWNARYGIIKGICNGLDYLHNEKGIYHMDLKPANVLLDSNMVPKITDFGQSRYDQKSQTISINRYGSRGYCPPEYALFGKMSPKSDMYSLGTIIIELVTGDKEIPNNNKNYVLRRWRHRWRKTGKENALGYQQVTKCIDIGLLCQQIDPCNRPFIWEIVRDINAMEATNSQISNDNESTIGQISPYSDDDMLGIEPLELHFPFKINKKMSCSLELTNETDSYIAFDIKKISPLPYCTEPHKGIVLPRSKCSVDITLQPQYRAPQTANAFTVRSTKVNPGLTTEHISTAMFNKCMGNDVDEVNLEAIFYEVTPGSGTLLDVHPLELRFPFEPNKLITCSLDLTNNTDERVKFGLVKKNDGDACFFNSLPFFGLLEPGTICTLVVTMNKKENLPQERNFDLILQTNTYHGSLNEETLENTAHKVTLKGVCAMQGDMIFEKSFPPPVKIILMEDNSAVYVNMIYCMDANQTESLIVTGHLYGHVLIRNYELQKIMGRIEIPHRNAAYIVKFIARKGWCVVGTRDGFIYVYDYKKEMQNVKCFRAGLSRVYAIAIHPTQSYVLSAADDGGEIKLWDWDNDWKHMQTFKEHSGCVSVIAFDPEDHNCFAGGYDDGTIKVWSLDSPESKYTLSEHSDTVECLDYFSCNGQQYLITGSKDTTAKIWDMQTKECIRILPHMSRVSSVLPHPKLPLLVTGTWAGDINLWSLTSFRLKRILKFSSRLLVRGLACSNESGRFTVAHENGVSVIEIRDEEEQGGSSSNNESLSAAD